MARTPKGCDHNHGYLTHRPARTFVQKCLSGLSRVPAWHETLMDSLLAYFGGDGWVALCVKTYMKAEFFYLKTVNNTSPYL